MIFTRKIMIETTCSRSEVLRRLREVIETRHDPNAKSDYRGEFVKEGFLLTGKTSVGSFTDLWVFGKFTRTETGTNINVTIKYDWKVKAIFLVITVALVPQLVVRLIRGVGDWPLFLAFLVFLWGFSILGFWLEVRGFKRTIEPLFAECKDARKELPKSLKENNS